MPAHFDINEKVVRFLWEGKPKGILTLLEQGAFDTIYHEHVSYWALTPIVYLCERYGMRVVHAERVPLHHGQLRVSVQRRGEGEVQPSVERLLDMERRLKPVRAASFGVLVVALLVTAPRLGWWTLAPFGAAVAAFGIADFHLDRRKRFPLRDAKESRPR